MRWTLALGVRCQLSGMRAINSHLRMRLNQLRIADCCCRRLIRKSSRDHEEPGLAVRGELPRTINTARHARSCARLRAAIAIASQVFDGLSVAGTFPLRRRPPSGAFQLKPKGTQRVYPSQAGWQQPCLNSGIPGSRNLQNALLELNYSTQPKCELNALPPGFLDASSHPLNVKQKHPAKTCSVTRPQAAEKAGLRNKKRKVVWPQ
jgi:hypothetical protein